MLETRSKLSPMALAIMGALTAMPATTVLAQDSEKEEGKLEHIQVTSRKVTENLQEVPVAVTSVGEVQLAEKGISVMTEVQQFSPNTTLQRSRGTNSTITAFIRGVGQQDPLWGYEPGVGIYIDDVYVARPQGAVLDILDVERIEVLRGPQGSLYGKNTIGGAVKYVTKRMSGETEFNIKGTLGTYDQRDIKLSGQVPLLDDTLFLGFGYADLNRDGFGKFRKSDLDNQDRENYNKDVKAMRLTMEYHPTDSLFMRLGWDKTEDTSNAKGGFRLLPSILTDAPVPDSKYDSYTSMPTYNLVETEGLNLTVDWTVNDDLSLKYIASTREGYSPTNIDFDNTTLRIFDVPAIYDDEQTTHELQFNLNGERHTTVGGLYYYDAESCGTFDAILEVLGNALSLPGLTREVAGCSNGNSVAAYVQSSIQLDDKWSLTLGARYTEDEKEAFVTNGLAFETLYPESGWVPGYVRPDIQMPMVLGTDTNGDGVLDAPKKASWSRFTPRAGVEYQASDDVMLFASYSQGFKSGTFNPRASTNEPAANPEVVDSFEVGIKADLTDNFRANVTLFSLDHKDRQYVVVLPGENAGDLNQRLGNVGTSTSSGVEAEMTWVATERLTLTAALGFIDSSFEEVLQADASGEMVDISERFSVSNTPKTTMNLGANYSFSSDVGDIVLNANYYARGAYDLFELDTLLRQDDYALLNIGATWYSNDGRWSVGLYGKNLTDEEYMVGGYQFVTPGEDKSDLSSYTPGLGGDNTLIGYYGDPRTVQLTVGYTF